MKLDKAWDKFITKFCVLVREGGCVCFTMPLEEEEEDRISSLPDCLLIEILSRLGDTKYAIRTGTLCKRWQHLWPQLSNLLFTQDTERNIPQFYSSVERILSQTPQLNKFKLHAFYNDQTQLSNCIRSANSCNVQEVDLCMFRDRICLPDFFFTCSSFIHLTLNSCTFEKAGVVSWKHLKSLRITYSYLHEELIKNILSGCPLLETLELAGCGGFERIDITTNKSVKNLGLSEHRDPDCMDIIQINAPYILTLAIKGHLMLKDFMLLNVSSLIKAELNYSKEISFDSSQPVDMQLIHEEQETNEEMLKGHLLNLAHAKEVIIGELCLETLTLLKAEGFIIPSNLTVLGEIASG